MLYNSKQLIHEIHTGGNSMAGIIQRFKDIMSANINSLLDKAEDPSKMIDQYLRNLETDLGNVKAETAAVMAEATRCQRELQDCDSEIAKMQSYAEKAVAAGNDDDARTFLEKKQQLMNNRVNLDQANTVAKENADKMRQMHDKLVKDIDDLNARKNVIKSKVAVAKTQEKLNKIGASVAGAADNLSAFDKMEAKANKMLDEANAMQELNQTPAGEKIEDLVDKYEAQPSASVEDELAALKAKMNK